MKSKKVRLYSELLFNTRTSLLGDGYETGKEDLKSSLAKLFCNELSKESFDFMSLKNVKDFGAEYKIDQLVIKLSYGNYKTGILIPALYLSEDEFIYGELYYLRSNLDLINSKQKDPIPKISKYRNGIDYLLEKRIELKMDKDPFRIINELVLTI